MDGSAIIQLTRELDAVKRELDELKKQLEPVFNREKELQFKEEMDRTHPYGWGWIDPNDHSKGVWGG